MWLVPSSQLLVRVSYQLANANRFFHESKVRNIPRPVPVIQCGMRGEYYDGEQAVGKFSFYSQT